MTDLPALAFNGLSLRRRDEMLNLTDMWRAAGGDPAKKPALWRQHDGADDFIRHVAGNVGQDYNSIFLTVRGRAGGTWAHWQIALAYV